MTRNQGAALCTVDRTKWFGPDLTNASEPLTYGGVITYTNLRGDVMKIYGDGRIQIVTHEQIENL